MTHTPPPSRSLGRRNLRRLAIIWSAGGFALTAALAGGMALNAQSIAAHNSNAPVDFDAQRIELDDRENRVILSGGVIIKQAELTLRSERTLLSFNDTDRIALLRITATGGVEVTRGDERASGDDAIYDFNRRIITMAGNVRLRRGADTLNGRRLVIDLNSGLSSVDGGAGVGPGGSGAGGSGSGGRVTGTFNVPQRANDKPQ